MPESFTVYRCRSARHWRVKRLDAINEIDEIMIATRHTNFPVKKGDRLLGTRVIPLVIAKEKMEQVKKTAGETPLVSLTPYKKKTVGIVTTGNEVYYGRIKDTFTPVIIEKMKEYKIEVCGHIVCNDDMEKITKAILELKEKGRAFDALRAVVGSHNFLCLRANKVCHERAIFFRH